MSNNSNFYEKGKYDYTAIERVVLAKDLKVTSLVNTQAQFYVPFLTPTLDQTSATDRNTRGQKTTNYVTLTIPSHLLLPFAEMSAKTLYVDSTGAVTTRKSGSGFSVISAKLPITIPAKTQFLAEFLGGHAEIDTCRIVGIY